MKDKTLNITRAALFAVALAFIVWGAVSGEAYDVFRKATKICLECIGIG